MQIQQWYWPEDNDERSSLHWELLKYCRPKSIDMLGQEYNDRYINIGKMEDFKAELAGKFKQSESPEWDFYATVEHVQKSNKIPRQEFKDQVNSGKNIYELAYKWRTFPKTVKKRIQKMEDNQLRSTVEVPANLGAAEIPMDMEDLTEDKTRSQVQHEFWTHYLYEETPPFNLVLDIDTDKKDTEEAIMQSYRETKKIVAYLDKLKTPYAVKTSGNKGFHIEIPNHTTYGKKLDRYVDSNNFREFGKQFAEFISDKTGVKLKSRTDNSDGKTVIDDHIYSSKRIFRVPYTIHTESGLLCMPLTEHQFQNFEMKYMSPDYVRNNIDLYNRGLCTRTGKANKLFKQFNQWKEDKDKQDTSNEKVKTSKYSEIDQLASRINDLTPEEKQKLKDKSGLNAQ